MDGTPRFGLWETLAAVSRLSRIGCIDGRRPCLAVQRTTALRASLRARPRATAALPSSRRRPAARIERQRAGERSWRWARELALGGRERIDYRDLGVEELGAVYERLLDVDDTREAAKESRGGAHSAARKRSGTFYTPRALADFVVRRTLAPLVESSSSDQILRLRVVDPAMGSGAFLVAACRYLEAAYSEALVHEGRLSPADIDEDRRAEHRRVSC
jgi:hypothetical protein